MKIKSLGFMSFLISCDTLNVVTDPQSIEQVGLKFPKTEADVVVVSDEKYLGKVNVVSEMGLSDKIVPAKKTKTFEIVNFGEYEIGEVMFRRPTNKNFFLIDQDYIRIMYMGYIGADFNIDSVKNLGDVDVLIAPVGDGAMFPPFQKMQKIIGSVDPKYFIPCGYMQDGIEKTFPTLKTAEDFLKDAGYSNVRTEKDLKITETSSSEDKIMEVVILEA
jgi:L-ascorbate metabolism protein UlaG (beta-lactamase superfamily)